MLVLFARLFLYLLATELMQIGNRCLVILILSYLVKDRQYIRYNATYFMRREESY